MTRGELIIEITEESVAKRVNEIVAQRMEESDKIVDALRDEVEYYKLKKCRGGGNGATRPA